jgi:hypothetical protein
VPKKLADILAATGGFRLFASEDDDAVEERARVRECIGGMSAPVRRAFFEGVAKHPSAFSGLAPGEAAIVVRTLALHGDAAERTVIIAVLESGDDLHEVIATLSLETRVALRGEDFGLTRREIRTLRKRGRFALARAWGLLPKSVTAFLPEAA